MPTPRNERECSYEHVQQKEVAGEERKKVSGATSVKSDRTLPWSDKMRQGGTLLLRLLERSNKKSDQRNPDPQIFKARSEIA